MTFMIVILHSKWHTFTRTFLLFLGIFVIPRFLFRTSLAFAETPALPGKSVRGRLLQFKEPECRCVDFSSRNSDLVWDLGQVRLSCWLHELPHRFLQLSLALPMGLERNLLLPVSIFSSSLKTKTCYPMSQMRSVRVLQTSLTFYVSLTLYVSAYSQKD